MTVLTDAKAIVRILFGLANAAAAGFFMFLEYHVPPTHTTHIAIFAAWIAFGLAVMAPSIFFPTWQRIVLLIPVDWRPVGMRKTDGIQTPPAAPPADGP